MIHRYLANNTYILENMQGEPSLDQLQKWVGGYIEHVSLRNFRDEEGVHKTAQMFVDEEGKLKGKPMNLYATKLFQSTWGAGDVIVGDVVILTGKNEAK